MYRLSANHIHVHVHAKMSLYKPAACTLQVPTMEGAAGSLEEGTTVLNLVAPTPA